MPFYVFKKTKNGSGSISFAATTFERLDAYVNGLFVTGRVFGF
jgi:hypothetical protein